MANPLSRRFWAILAMMMVVPAVLAAAYLASFENPGPQERPECPTPLAGAEAELDVRIEGPGPTEPRATVSILVDVPYDNDLARDLLSRTRDDPEYKLVLVCALSEPHEAGYIWDQPPSVTKEGNRVVVRTRTSRSINTFSGGDTGIGALVVQVLDAQHWRATIRQPTFLSLARWREVSVTAPAGWLSGVQLKPAVDAQRINWERLVSKTPGSAAERIRWERPAPGTSSEDNNLAFFMIHPDMRTQMASTAQSTRWIWATYLLEALNTLILVGLLVWWAHRSRARLVRRMCLPVLAITLAVTVDKITHEYGWYAQPWDILLLCAVILIVALAWGMPRTAVAAAVVVGPGLAFAIGFLAVLWQPADEFTLDLVYLGAFVVLAFELTVLLLAGLINAVRVLLSGSRPLRAPLWVWLSGAALATVLMVEQFVNIHRLFLSPWLDVRTVSPWDSTWALTYFPSIILDRIAPLLPLVAVIGAWALIRERMEDRFVILLFVMGSVPWAVAPFGPLLPVWPLAWLVLWLWLWRSRPLLDLSLSPPGSTVRSVIGEHHPDELRSAAAMWARIRYRGRALDRDLAKGTIPIDVHTAETKKLLDTPLLPDPGKQTINQLREAAVTPIDVMVALGPMPSPLENAKRGALFAALVGAPAAALELWLWWHQPGSEPTPTLWSSDLLDGITVVLWEASRWLVAGAVLGLLWQRLPFRRGIAKALPLITAFAAVQLVSFATDELIGGRSLALLSIGLFTAVTAVTAVFMDLSALRSGDIWWSRGREAFAAAYGMDNLSTKVAFVGAQVVILVTILDLLMEWFK